MFDLSGKRALVTVPRGHWSGYSQPCMLKGLELGQNLSRIIEVWLRRWGLMHMFFPRISLQ